MGCNSTYRLRYWNRVVGTATFLPSLSCNSTYRLRYWNTSWNFTNVSGASCWVATVLTVYGIETLSPGLIERDVAPPSSCNSTYRLRYWNHRISTINTNNFFCCNSTYRLRYWNSIKIWNTCICSVLSCNSTYRLRYWNVFFVCTIRLNEEKLQQYLPFTVLKPEIFFEGLFSLFQHSLQQYIPFTVVKL